MITIVKRRYISTDASVIRTIAIAKGLGEQNVKTRIIFLMPIIGADNKLPKIHNVSFVCPKNFHNRYLNIINGILKMLKILRNDDVIILMSFLFPIFIILYMYTLFHKKTKFYHERTEYPLLLWQQKKFCHTKESIYLSIVKKIDGIFVISSNIKKYFINNGVCENKIHIINMIVDENRFKDLQKEESERYIAYCGTVSNAKDGVDILLRAFSVVFKKNNNIKLYILGRTPMPSDMDLNKSIVKDNFMDDVVYMPGVVPANKIPQYLKNAEILALARPNNMQAFYGFPTKLGEYLLTGNPVILTRVGNIDDFLIDKESCLFVEPNSVEDFANKLLWLLENPIEGKRIGENGEMVAKKKFNYRIEAKKIIDVLKIDAYDF